MILVTPLSSLIVLIFNVGINVTETDPVVRYASGQGNVSQVSGSVNLKRPPQSPAGTPCKAHQTRYSHILTASVSSTVLTPIPDDGDIFMSFLV